jgi:2-oxoglutarate ferredoxin oxidoreductase subunit beta
MKNRFDMGRIDIAWCPGCGNYGILEILKQVLTDLDIRPANLVMVSGIGQAAKVPHYMWAHFFNGLHGRALPPATAIKAANPSLTVIAESGDGDMYGEGGNHFIHTIRRNPGITNIVHNNMVYGLTKGQASPTSQIGFKTAVQVAGVILEPFNPLAVAIALDAGFVARAFVRDTEQTKDILKKAITHKGYSLVDIFQPCVTFNKVNTYQWFKEHTYYLDGSHDPYDRTAAFRKACETEKFPLGVFYINPNKKPFEENIGIYDKDTHPLFERQPEYARLSDLVQRFSLSA